MYEIIKRNFNSNLQTWKELILYCIKFVSNYRTPILFVLCVVGLAIFIYYGGFED